jgi:hypothetical protein
MRPVPKMEGMRFGRWLVVEGRGRVLVGAKSRHMWLCRCDCGVEKVVAGRHLQEGKSQSCGCLSAENRRAVDHGGARRGARDPAYGVWAGMLQRCRNPRSAGFASYGGRGISVCKRWEESFADFLADVGPRPSPKHSIERDDVNGNYESGNVRWATTKEQARNTRRTVFEAHEPDQIRWLRAEGHTVPAIAGLLCVHPDAVSYIVHQGGWT